MAKAKAKAKAKKKKSGTFRILSIDGGGIRGIIPGQVLVVLEKKLKTKTGDSNKRIADYFDMIAGTSAGGILACAYLCPSDPRARGSRPKYSAQEAVNFYLDRGDEVFDIPTLHRIRTAGGLRDEKYPSDGLEEVLKDYFGDLMLSDLLKPCLITAYDIKNRRTHFFTQHNASAPRRNYRVRDVARATSAAPTYFEVARIKSDTNLPYPLIDGGVFANNPALCAYAEARTLSAAGHPTAKDMLILSLGTGHAKKSYSYKEAKDWGMLAWIKPVLDIMMTGVAETVDYELRQIYDAIGAPKQYLRLNPKLTANPEMDDAHPDNLIALKEDGQQVAEDNDALLDAFADRLIAP